MFCYRSTVIIGRREYFSINACFVTQAITENDITTDLSRELAAVNIINASNEPNINFLGQNRPVDQF